MIPAYDELYLDGAQRILGDAFDFAVHSLGLPAVLFAELWAGSEVSAQFEAGNPAVVAGVNGCELARSILLEKRVPFPEVPDAMYPDKSPEYWGGWALAYVQWSSGESFRRILHAVPFGEILEMYPLYHEMDITRFAEAIAERMQKAYPLTKLQEKRKNLGLSQSELARASGVPLRQIQLFEQRQRDIAKTQAVTLQNLARALHCGMEELI